MPDIERTGREILEARLLRLHTLKGVRDMPLRLDPDAKPIEEARNSLVSGT